MISRKYFLLKGFSPESTCLNKVTFQLRKTQGQRVLAIDNMIKLLLGLL